MTKQDFQTLTQNVVLLDGATGSNLMAAGMPKGVCTEEWVLAHKDVFQALQRGYVEAGSDIIYAPTFGGNRINLTMHHLQDQIKEINTRLVSYSREVADAASRKVIADMSGDNRRQVILKGGRGGLGNQHFATSTMQIPKYAQPGQPSQELWVNLELKVIADVGLVGFPNVGKSTFLSRVTNAQPKIANYHFTTLNPNLGVVDLPDGRGFVIADIPGLIEGASEGVGLGHEFLRHIERTKLMIHVVDAAGTEGRDPVDDIYKINAELKAYNADIANRPQVIAANKIDAIYSDPENDPIKRLKDEFEPQGYKVFPISGVTGEGLNELLYYVSDQLKDLDAAPIVFEQEYFPEDELIYVDLPYTVEKEDGMYVVEGPKIEKMLGYTNLDSEKGFAFFQKFLKDTGILKELEDAGIEEGDTVRMYGLQFDYYK